jgi:hypothetical protein
MAITGGNHQSAIPSQAAVNPAATVVQDQGGSSSGTAFGLTTGWYVFFGVGGGVLLSGTKVAPIVLGILSSALLYQISQLIEGK